MMIPHSCMSLKFLKNLLFHVKIALITSFTHLGFLKARRQGDEGGAGEDGEEPRWDDQSGSTVLIMEGSTPRLVPVRLLTAQIKKRVSVVTFREFLARNNGAEEAASEMGGGTEKMCTVCLNHIGERDEVRELLNCRHVFHRECLDLWVDENQVTCPLCRCLLFPPTRRSCGSVGVAS